MTKKKSKKKKTVEEKHCRNNLAKKGSTHLSFEQRKA